MASLELWRRTWLVVAAAVAILCGATESSAITIEMKDAAPDRVERQRAYAEGALPLPGTPELGQLQTRLGAKDMKLGMPVFIRIFKAESELEVWMEKGERFELLDTYPICHWSGTLGPKLREGDKQNPEGFYSIGARQLHRVGRWPRSLNLGFPNTLDRALKRSGSYILVHGGCSSVGCFAMTNPVIEEIYTLVEAALRAGQERIGVHVFPFRMTEENLGLHALNPWADFWQELRPGYDIFERTRVPPRIGYCDQRYVIEPAAPGEVGEDRPLALCGGGPVAQVDPSSQSLAQLPPTWPWLPLPTAPPRISRAKPLLSSPARVAARVLAKPTVSIPPKVVASAPAKALVSAAKLIATAARETTAETTSAKRGKPPPPTVRQAATPTVQCNPGLVSCRRFIALRSRAMSERTRVATAAAHKLR